MPALLALLGAASATAEPLRGLSLSEAIDSLQRDGLDVVYSSSLVKPEMRVLVEPESADPRSRLEEIVAPFGLAIASGPAGTLLLVRAPTPPEVSAGAVIAAPLAELSEVVVSASHYRFAVDATRAPMLLSAVDLGLLPEIGEDALRAVARLPGVARQDFTSKPHLRGGGADETLVRFDGLRLYNPFHLKDFQSLFSAIDPGVVRDLTVYTAGFPVTYGDRMSGVIDITPLAPLDEFGGQLALSLFNAGGRLGGSFDDGRGDWVAFARRGNLDLVLDVVDPDLGQPNYVDLYGRVGHQISANTRVSLNVLSFEDDLQIFDSDQEERAEADYRDEYYWLTVDYGSPQSQGGRLLAAHTRLTSERSGTADLPGIGSGSLQDRRRFEINSVQLDTWWSLPGTSTLEAGVGWRGMRGRYAYQDAASFDLLFLTPGAPTGIARARDLAVAARGDQYGAYVNWRVQPARSLTGNIGLRWDKETLSGDNADQLSPRLSLMWAADDSTRIRASWGRFFQAQGIDELPVSDGETVFYPAQRADHAVVSIERLLGDGLSLRLEGYRKNYNRLRPRYENLLESLFVLPELKPDRIRVDPRRAVAEGAEITLDYDPDGRLAGWASYSWSSVKDTSASGSFRRSWDQEHAITTGASRRGPRWEWSVVASWRSGWPTTDVELLTDQPVPLVATGPRNAARLGSYLRLDGRIARRFSYESGSELTLFFEVSNLTNRRNDCCVEYEIETVDGATRLDAVTRASLPLVPSIGFVWDF